MESDGYEYKANFNCKGHDIGNTVSNTNALQCRELCERDKLCKLYILQDTNCHLKSTCNVLTESVTSVLFCKKNLTICDELIRGTYAQQVADSKRRTTKRKKSNTTTTAAPEEGSDRTETAAIVLGIIIILAGIAGGIVTCRKRFAHQVASIWQMKQPEPTNLSPESLQETDTDRSDGRKAKRKGFSKPEPSKTEPRGSVKPDQRGSSRPPPRGSIKPDQKSLTGSKGSGRPETKQKGPIKPDGKTQAGPKGSVKPEAGKTGPKGPIKPDQKSPTGSKGSGKPDAGKTGPKGTDKPELSDKVLKATGKPEASGKGPKDTGKPGLNEKVLKAFGKPRPNEKEPKAAGKPGAGEKWQKAVGKLEASEKGPKAGEKGPKDPGKPDASKTKP